MERTDSTFDSYFYSLVKPKTPRKKRGCLRCAKVFLSDHYGNRVCAQCREIKVGAVESQAHVPYEAIRHRI
jgi:ribosomal protein S27AE